MGHIYFMMKKSKKSIDCYNRVNQNLIFLPKILCIFILAKAINLSNELKCLLNPCLPILKLMSKKCMKEALIICNHVQDENRNNYVIYYLKAIILNNLNNEQIGFFHFNHGRQTLV